MPDRPSGGNGNLNSRERRELFLQLAASPGGATVADVHQRARELGDGATEEAFYNIARRLAHRGLVVAETRPGERTRYAVGASGEDRWLEEDELAELVDPDYPIEALSVWRESIRQVNDVPESIWIELRHRLAGADARGLFVEGIISYASDFNAQIAELDALGPDADAVEIGLRRKEAESSHRSLVHFTKHGLGLPKEAIDLPPNIDVALANHRADRDPARVDEVVLVAEIERRVEPGPFVRDVEVDLNAEQPLVAAVDGSTRSGVLSVLGEGGDFNVAHAPMVTINTAIGQVNRNVEVRGRIQNLFLRLPERPEDMQRQDNRHTVMAKILHPDLTDAEYVHAVLNAMDLVETRVTHRLLKRWYTPDGRLEIPPADIVLRDGTVTPQDRDFTHYKQQDSYGRIVRDMIEAGWDVALLCRDEGRIACGVVKQSQLHFFGPILNWYACRVANDPSSQIKTWPLHTMNLVSDQMLVTRLLTAGRGRGDQSTRTCITLRPFHAVTNFAKSYELASPLANAIRETQRRALSSPDQFAQDDRVFWANFQGDNDPFVKMLQHVQYGSFFLAAIPRLDKPNLVPRLELLVPLSDARQPGALWDDAVRRGERVVAAITAGGFDVAAEHNMFETEPKLDIMPRLLIKAHDTVKIWAAELLGRVQEYVGYHLARYMRLKRARGVQVRPFSRQELTALYDQLRAERERRAGGSQAPE